MLFIDGSNLYGGLTELLGAGRYFDFPDLLKEIEQDWPLTTVKFYGTYMRVDPSKPPTHQLITRAQKAFFDSAKRVKKLSFYKGHFSGSGKEKGIDVHLAVDLAVGASQDRYDEAIIMTGDADLLYCVEIAQSLGKPVHLAALSSRFPFALSFKADQRLVYDYDGFFLATVLPQLKRQPQSVRVRELKGRIPVRTIKQNPTQSAG